MASVATGATGAAPRPRLHERVRAACAAIGAASALWACGEPAAPPPPPVDVVVAPVVQRDVPITSEWIGTTEGAVDAEIRAQVPGYLIAREYAEGTIVKKGDVLFRVDPRSARAALDQARGDLGRARAALAKSRLDVDRYTPLAREGAVSRQELDNAIQSLRANEALVQAAQAAVDSAQVDLGYTEVRSPIDGIAGIARAQLGNLVGPTDPQPLTSVSQVDPIRVRFPLSEREYLRFAEAFRKRIDGGANAARGDGGASVELLLADGSTWPHRGFSVPASQGIDPSTGTIQVRAEFPNPDFLLRPGQYARVRVVTELRKGALLVPQRAVAEMQGVHQVALVGPDDKIAMRVVEPGPRFESLQIIEKGLAPGDRIVVEGLQKVRDGVVVNPKTAAAAAAPQG